MTRSENLAAIEPFIRKHGVTRCPALWAGDWREVTRASVAWRASQRRGGAVTTVIWVPPEAVPDFERELRPENQAVLDFALGMFDAINALSDLLIRKNVISAAQLADLLREWRDNNPAEAVMRRLPTEIMAEGIERCAHRANRTPDLQAVVPLKPSLDGGLSTKREEG